MSAQSIHARENLVASLASETTVLATKLLMVSAAILSDKPPVAARPFALVEPVLIVGPHMT